MRAIGCLAALLTLAAGLAQAQPTTTFTISAVITAGCLVNQALPPEGGEVGEIGRLDFGTAPALAQETLTAELLTSGTFTLSCTPGVHLSMRIDGGLQQSDGDRQLVQQAGNATLAYQLYHDAAFQSAIAIDQPVSVDTLTNPDNITLPIWGRTLLPGHLPAGVYRDTLVVTLEW